MTTPKFLQPNLTFTHELKNRVNEYFEKNNIAKTGNFKLYSKAIILIVLLLAVYIHVVFFTPGVVWALLESVALGFLAAAIGFNVMHDGSHGSFSKYRFINRLAAHSLDALGGSSVMWSAKHNIIHHTYTNVEGVDDDIDAQPYLRLSPDQKRYKIHKYQQYYFLALYAFLYFFWVFQGDFKKYFTQKIGDIQIPPMKWKDHVSFWGSKILFVSIFMLIPIYMIGFGAWLLGFIVFLATTGVLISVVFQLAHTVEKCETVHAVDAKIEQEWTVHQLLTTCNFATQNRIVNWFTGGLNFQVEHHLFPRISHIHYPAISKITKEVCEKYNVTYNEYKHTRDAILSHIRYLRRMGTMAGA